MKKIFLFLSLLILSTPQSLFAAYFHDVELHSVSSGDTIVVSIPDLPEIFGKKIPVILEGIEVPKARGRCYQENDLAKKAENRVEGLLFKAKVISLANVKRDHYFRLVGNVMADGKDISGVLLNENLAKIKTGRNQTDWCSYRRQGRSNN